MIESGLQLNAKVAIFSAEVEDWQLKLYFWHKLSSIHDSQVFAVFVQTCYLQYGCVIFLNLHCLDGVSLHDDAPPITPAKDFEKAFELFCHLHWQCITQVSQISVETCTED